MSVSKKATKPAKKSAGKRAETPRSTKDRVAQEHELQAAEAARRLAEERQDPAVVGAITPEPAAVPPAAEAPPRADSVPKVKFDNTHTAGIAVGMSKWARSEGVPYEATDWTKIFPLDQVVSEETVRQAFERIVAEHKAKVVARSTGGSKSPVKTSQSKPVKPTTKTKPEGALAEIDDALSSGALMLFNAAVPFVGAPTLKYYDRRKVLAETIVELVRSGKLTAPISKVELWERLTAMVQLKTGAAFDMYTDTDGPKMAGLPVVMTCCTEGCGRVQLAVSHVTRKGGVIGQFVVMEQEGQFLPAFFCVVCISAQIQQAVKNHERFPKFLPYAKAIKSARQSNELLVKDRERVKREQELNRLRQQFREATGTAS